MPDETLRQLLSDSAQAVLETMFFAIPDEVSMDPARPAGSLIAAGLAFEGAPSGRFGLVASEPLAQAFTANFIGDFEDSAPAAEKVAGVMAELANMICGALLSKIESGANFDLGAPATTLMGPEAPDPEFCAGSPATCRLEFPEGTLLSFFDFQEPA